MVKSVRKREIVSDQGTGLFCCDELVLNGELFPFDRLSQVFNISFNIECST